MGRFISQTEMAGHFHVSSITLGKKLIDLNLKEPKTKLATKKALEADLAKNITRKDTLFSIWNKSLISKIEKNLTKDPIFCSNIIIGCFNAFKEISKQDDGTKIYVLWGDSIWQDLDHFFFIFSKNQKSWRGIHNETLKLAKNKGYLNHYLEYLETKKEDNDDLLIE